MLLRISDLKTYFYQEAREIKAVDGVGLDIKKGQLVALVGESGSGKTVTALSVTKLITHPGKIVSGRAVFEDGDLLKLSEKQLQKIRGATISYIFQEPASSLNPVFTVGYQIAESIRLHRGASKKKSLELAEELLRQVGIDRPEDRLSAYPHQLSGGMKQRTMIAMAICSQPKLLIADEPTTALDVTIQVQILKLLKELQAKLGLSILLITHDVSIVKSLADKIYIMQYGKIVESGNTKDIFANPKHPYTKKLLDSIPKPSELIYEESKEPTLLEAKRLKKYFTIEKGPFRIKAGLVKAVDGVGFSLRKGQTLGVVGESGSGKTTLAKLLLGLLKPDEGEIIYRGKQMQIVFQDPVGSLNPRMRIKDIISEPLVVKGVGDKRQRKQRVAELLEQVGLRADYTNRFPHQFSGGERQRIAIARALATNPELLICDEPVSALDLTIQAQILRLLMDIQQRLGITYLFITHDLRVIEQVSDEVLVMFAGQIVEQNDAKSIYHSPRHPYTKRLLSSAKALSL